ncbi:MAG: insulinase family protein [Nanoarchaeota archaeon]|nr:insulinase family protein [Nanoarchaeota archaeon]
MVRTRYIYGAPVQKAILDNGLTLITSKVNTPATAINISLKAGMNREPRELGGLAHFLEHMLFEGTSGRTQEKIAKMMDEHGSDYNAGTDVESIESTSMVVNEDLPEALKLMAEMTFEVDINPRRVGTERNVVLQELREDRDVPEEVVDDHFHRDLLKKHPARYPVLGKGRTIKAIKPSHLRDFYGEFFVPNNIILTIVGGGISGGVTGRTRGLVEKLPFGKRSAQELPEYPFTDEPLTVVGTERFIRKSYFDAAYVTLGVLLKDEKGTINYNHPDHHVASVISNLLTEGERSRLFWLVRKKGGHCYGIESDFDTYTDLGLFAVSFSTAKSRVKKVLNIIYREIERFKTTLVPEEELKREKISIAKACTMAGQDLDDRAEEFALYEAFSRRGLGDLERHLDCIEAVTPERIRDFARRFFDLNKFSLVAYTP